MLSVENPPGDPPCPCEISQLKTSSSDERASSSSSAKLEAVDLLNSGLDDNNYPLPKFSIRDYVFSSRSKDIKNNWPFSPEKLQLCLKHGVTEVLPPFQPLDAVRNPSQEKCNVSNSDEKPYGPSDEFVFVNSNAGSDQKLAVDCPNINSSGSEGDRDFPSTTTSQSCSYIDSVPTNKSPSLESEANTLTEPLVAKSEAVIPSKFNKAESSNQKKCKLIVKLSNLAHTSTKEDTAMNNYMVSEAMASKVCPVCKTFSSSSNTTLNAHIDQCLSGESTTKCMADSRVIKHRIKPRKMKSMVEIYATASHCTLEELDRRNGTNWASTSSMPVQEFEKCAERNKQGPSPVNSDETPNGGAVYIDANGTKVRILSKFNDPSPDSKMLDDSRPKKLLKGDKGGKYLLAKKKKKKNLVDKQHKLLRHASHGNKISTPEIDKAQDKSFSGEENYRREDCMPQQLKGLDQVKVGKQEMIRGWVCSKRTGLTKKTNGRDGHLASGGCVDREPESIQSSLCTNAKRSSIVKIRNENLPSSANKRIDNLSHEPHDEHPSPRKRLGVSAMESQLCRDRKRPLVLQEFQENTSKHLRDDGPSNRENHSSSVSKRRIETISETVRYADHSVINPKKSSGQRTFVSKSKKFSILKKNALSAGRASASDSKYSKRKCSAAKKSRMLCISGMKQKEVVSRLGVDRHFMQNPSNDQAIVEGTSDEESIERTRVIKIRSGGERIVSRSEETVSLKNSHSKPITHCHDAGESGDSLMHSGALACSSDTVESAGKSERGCRRDINVELPSEEAAEGTFMDLSKTLDCTFHELEDPCDTQCDSQHQFIETYKGPLFESEAPRSSAEPILSGDQEMFRTDQAVENRIGESVGGMVELNSNNGQGNYFGEVDSIPIPGPPGSFLPSPGRMDSEDFHGNSSLSSSKIQSSDDHHELIDHSSESPVSTTSSISNSTLGRSDLKSSERFSAEPPLLDEMRSNLTTVATNVVDPFVENLAPIANALDRVAEKQGPDEAKVTVTSEKEPLRFKNDQPCCCSRKESLSQNVALNFQESALLRRRNMTSVITPANAKQMNGDFSRRLENLSVNERSVVTEETVSRPSMEPISSRVSSDSEAKLSIRESADPPTPSPVLRLMGKNLMVVNKDESVAPQLRTSQSSTMNVHSNSQAAPIPVVSTGASQNEEHRIVHHAVSQGPFFFDQTEPRGFMQHSDMRWSNGFGNHGISPGPQMSPVASAATVSSRNPVRGLPCSLMHHEYTDGYRSPTHLLQPMHRPGIPMAYDMDKVAESPSLRWRTADLPANTPKEIIIIDDTPDNEVDSTMLAAHSQHKRDGPGPSASISVSRPSVCDTWSMNPFYVTQPFESVTYTSSPVDASFRLPPTKGSNAANPMRWTCTPEVSTAVHPNSLAAPSSSTPHLRSELYNPSGF